MTKDNERRWLKSFKKASPLPDEWEKMNLVDLYMKEVMFIFILAGVVAGSVLVIHLFKWLLAPL